MTRKVIPPEVSNDYKAKTILHMNKLHKALIVITLFLPSAVNSGLFGPSNYYECILDEMPEVQSNHDADQISRMCRKDYPDRSDVEMKEPIFGVKTVSECVEEYGKDVLSDSATSFIRSACRRLYPY